MPPIPAAPTTEIGAPTRNVSLGTLFGSGGVIIDEREQNRDLAWPRSNRTYASMFNDAQIDGLYRGMTWAIRAYDWWLDPNGARPETVDRVSADYNLPVGRGTVMNRRRSQGRFQFSAHLEDALRGIGYGHYFFEQLYNLAQDGNTAVNAGWVAHLRKLAARPPYTISEIRSARDGGLDHIKVPALNPNDGRAVPFSRDVKLTVDRLVAYVWDREGANWYGRSMLRSLYRPWKVKDRVIKVGAINIERAGGVPYATAPPDVKSKTEMDALLEIATTFRVGDNAGAVLPHGAELKFATAAGGSEAAAYVRLQNEEMARAWLLMFMQLGGGGGQDGGSRALAEPLIDYVSLGQQVVAGWFRDTFNEHVIEDDVELNEGPGEEYAPLLAFAPKGDALDPFQGALEDAAAADALPSDSQVMAMVRSARAGAGGRSTRRPFRQDVIAAVGDTPAGHEQFTDWTDLDAQWTAARDQLVDSWLEIRAGQIEHLVAQIEAADGDLDQLAVLSTAAQGADAIAAALRDLAAYGVRTARDEATAQGHSLPAPAMDELETSLEQRAEAVAGLLTRALSETAARHAVQRTGGSLAPTEVATEVADHLRGLSNAYLEQQLGGALTAGLNGGRRTAMGGAPAGTRYFASALLDTNVCGPCSLDDGHEYDSLVDAELQFPVGGNKDCEGDVRCRCTIVAQYPESAPSVQ